MTDGYVGYTAEKSKSTPCMNTYSISRNAHVKTVDMRASVATRPSSAEGTTSAEKTARDLSPVEASKPGRKAGEYV
eukprot:6253232-Prymnesium_polylepis.1